MDYDSPGTDWDSNPSDGESQGHDNPAGQQTPRDNSRRTIRKTRNKQAMEGPWLIANNPHLTDHILVKDMFHYSGEVRLSRYIDRLNCAEGINSVTSRDPRLEQLQTSELSIDYLTNKNAGRKIVKRRINAILGATSFTIETTDRRTRAQYQSYDNYHDVFFGSGFDRKGLQWGYIVMFDLAFPPVDLSSLCPELLMVIGVSGDSGTLEAPSKWRPKTSRFNICHPWNPKAEEVKLLSVTVEVDPTSGPLRHIVSFDVKHADFMLTKGTKSSHVNDLTPTYFPNLKYFRGFISECPKQTEYLDCIPRLTPYELKLELDKVPRLKGVVIEPLEQGHHVTDYVATMSSVLERRRTLMTIKTSTEMPDEAASVFWSGIWKNRDLEYIRLEMSASVAALVQFGVLDPDVVRLVYGMALELLARHEDDI